jgi:hypothetical protein
MSSNNRLIAGLALSSLCFIAAATPAGAATQLLPNYTEFGGGSGANTSSGLIGTTPTFTTGGSWFYGDSISSAVGGTALTGAPGFGFYEDYVFTIGAGAVDSITSTIALGNISSIGNLEVRLYNAASNTTLPVLGTPNGSVIDAWSTSNNSPSYTIDVLPTTTLDAGTYVLEVRGLVTGTSTGSYSGTLNVTPVPLAPALPLMLSALGGLGLLARRRTA